MVGVWGGERGVGRGGPGRGDLGWEKGAKRGGGDEGDQEWQWVVLG
jgi:hypothetical protein